MCRIKIPPQDFPLKMQGELMREGGAYLRHTTVILFSYTMKGNTVFIHNEGLFVVLIEATHKFQVKPTSWNVCTARILHGCIRQQGAFREIG